MAPDEPKKQSSRPRCEFNEGKTQATEIFAGEKEVSPLIWKRRKDIVAQLRFHFQDKPTKCRWLKWVQTLKESGFRFSLFFPSLSPKSLEEPGTGRELRTHTHPSMPACALLRDSTCLLLPNSWKNVKLSSVI